MFGFDDALMLANSKAGASLFGGIGQGIGDAIGGGGGPMVSGGTVDARSFMDGSGWTVSTGKSKADGGDRSQGENMPTATSMGASLQGGMSTTTVLLVVLVLAFMWKARQ